MKRDRSLGVNHYTKYRYLEEKKLRSVLIVRKEEKRDKIGV